jgi:hypothetical protein
LYQTGVNRFNILVLPPASVTNGEERVAVKYKGLAVGLSIGL